MISNCYIFAEGSTIELDFEDIWPRIQQATGIKSITQLSKILDIKQPSMSRAKKDGRFPVKWALDIARRYMLNSDWLLYGRGPKHYGIHATKKINDKLEILSNVLKQVDVASSLEEHEACMAVALKLREELLSTEPISIEEKAELADARILELEDALLELSKKNELLKDAITPDMDPKVSTLINKAKHILTSGNAVAFDALERNINYFAHAVDAEIELQQLKDDVKIIKEEFTKLKRENLRLDTEAEEQSLKKKVA